MLEEEEEDDAMPTKRQMRPKRQTKLKRQKRPKKWPRGVENNIFSTLKAILQ
jgi:hypothetical protein